jgi:hemolysin III
MTHDQRRREERANAASHGLGLLLALLAVPLLALADAGRPATARLPAGVWVFVLSMLAVYAASAAYHALPAGRAKGVLQRVDHAAIYLFMAGSYTPFALQQVPGGDGWAVFGAVWAAAALGMALKLLNRLRQRWWSTALYVAFGWAVVLAAQPLLATLPPATLALVIGGGLAYSVGTLFFLLDGRLRYSHLVWHLFVLAGSACHFAAVLHGRV